MPKSRPTSSPGTDPDEGAVVDQTLAVHGLDGLSIVDASVIPEPPSGFTHLPTIMLAEAFADHFEHVAVRSPSR